MHLLAQRAATTLHYIAPPLHAPSHSLLTRDCDRETDERPPDVVRERVSKWDMVPLVAIGIQSDSQESREVILLLLKMMNGAM